VQHDDFGWLPLSVRMTTSSNPVVRVLVAQLVHGVLLEDVKWVWLAFMVDLLAGMIVELGLLSEGTWVLPEPLPLQPKPHGAVVLQMCCCPVVAMVVGSIILLVAHVPLGCTESVGVCSKGQ